jgi:hypothetical protein
MESEEPEHAAEWRALREASAALRGYAERLCAEANALRAHAAALRAALPRTAPGGGGPVPPAAARERGAPPRRGP